MYNITYISSISNAQINKIFYYFNYIFEKFLKNIYIIKSMRKFLHNHLLRPVFKVAASKLIY